MKWRLEEKSMVFYNSSVYLVAYCTIVGAVFEKDGIGLGIGLGNAAILGR